jgi:hypothetical protein
MKNLKIKYRLIIFFWCIIAILSIVFSTKELFYNIPSSMLSGWMIGRYLQKLKQLKYDNEKS